MGPAGIHRKEADMINTVDNTVGGTFRDGHIVLDRPMKWAEGTRVVVQLMSEDCGLIEGVWPDDGSPEGEAEIARRLAELDALGPPSPEEAADLDASFAEMRSFLRGTHSKQNGAAP
jgi:hypothetical protein